MRVVLIMVSFNRVSVLGPTLRVVARQRRAPDAVVVVDNGSWDGTVEMLKSDFPDVEVIECGDNIGYGPGLAVGMRAMASRGFDAYWLMDDDSQPKPEALADLVETSEANPSVSTLALRGGSFRGGWIRHYKTSEQVRSNPRLGPGLYAVDFCLLDGTLVKQEAVDAVGYPRDDFFMMMEDVEYTTRIRQAGLRIGVLERDLMERAKLGGRGDSKGRPPWRAYYKARNHVRMAVDSRSPLVALGCVGRLTHLLVRACFSRKRGAERASMLLAGARDGMLGRMGRTLDPPGSLRPSERT